MPCFSSIAAVASTLRRDRQYTMPLRPGRGDEIQQLAAAVLLGDDAVVDVGAVEGTDELARILQRQALDDLAPRRGIGGGRERDARHGGPAFVQHREFAIFAAEVMAPLRHAVRFVDGEQRDPRAVQQRQETGSEQALGRDVQQVEGAFGQLPFHGA
jgi:hypothetical protein